MGMVGGTSPGSSHQWCAIVRRMGHRSWWARTGTRWKFIVRARVRQSEYTDPGGLGEGLADLDAVRVIHAGGSISSQDGSYRIHHCRIMGGWQISMDLDEAPADAALTVVELLPSGEADQGISPAQRGGEMAGQWFVLAEPCGGRVSWLGTVYRALAGGLRLEDAVEAVEIRCVCFLMVTRKPDGGVRCFWCRRI